MPGVLLSFIVSTLCFGILSYYVSWRSKKWNICSLPAGVNVLLFYFEVMLVMQPVLQQTNSIEKAYNVWPSFGLLSLL